LGGARVAFLRTLGVGVGIFYPTPTQQVQLNQFLHRTPESGISTRAYLEWYIFF